MLFMVYINRTRKRARLHRQHCAYVKMHGGVALSADQEWIGPVSIETAREALRTKAATFPSSEVRPCGSCATDIDFER